MTEIIWEKQKDFDFTETISNEIITPPSYDYWQSQNTLDYNTALRNKPIWWWQVKTLIFNRLASVWTWIQSFTGFWFTPTCYNIQATRTDITTSWNPCFSDWTYDWTTQLYRQVADWYSRALTWKVVRIFYTNQWGWVTSAIHSSFDSDGISLNFDFSAEDCYLVITAYK